MSNSKEVAAYLTVDELATRMRVSRRTVYRWKEAGLPFLQPAGPNGRIVFDLDAVREWVSARPSEGVA